MTFPNGSVVVTRMLDTISGEEHVMISYPDGWSIEQVCNKLAPGLDLSGFDEDLRSERGRSFLDRLNRMEVRETIGFKSKPKV